MLYHLNQIKSSQNKPKQNIITERMDRVVFDLDLDKIFFSDEYQEQIKDLLDSPEILKMAQYKHHGDVTCLEHSIHVSVMLYSLLKMLGLDARAGARAGLLHDLFLYDPYGKLPEGYKHFSQHPKIALQNCLKLFTLSKKEQDMILNHMWPVNLFSLPRYAETYLLTIVDKICAIMEYTVTKEEEAQLQTEN
jgi:uncharacterized protein